MLAPERMRKVAVIGPQTVMDKAVKELYRLKAVHIASHEKGELDIGTPFERADRLSQLLVTTRAVSSALGIFGKKELSNGFRAVGVKNLAGLERAVKKLNSEVSSVLSARKGAEDELKRLQAKESQLLPLQKLGLDLEAFSGLRSLSHFVGTVRDAKGVRSALLAATDRFELFSYPDKGADVIALFIDSAKREEASGLLAGFGFAEFLLTEVKGMKGPVPDALGGIAIRKEKLQKQVEAGQAALSRLGSKWNDFLLLSDQLIADELEKAQAPLLFGMSKKAFVVEGWVPAGKLQSIEQALSKATGERIYVDSGLPGHDDRVPVLMSNPKPARPFEFFMRLYALPKYDEIDPTLFTLFTFPLFFGFILGDIGYGFVTFFLLLWLKERMPGAAQLVSVLLPAAVSSIIFGFLFGEVFGFEQAFGMDFPHLISRAHSVNELMIISVIAGFIHVNLGFVLGFLNELRHHGLLKAFSAKLSWIFLEAGVALAVLSFTQRISLPPYFGIAVAVASVTLITRAEGIRGMIEVPGLLSNLVSYARLAAVGLSSVILAAVFNDMARDIAHAGPVGMVAAVVVLFLGHTLNLALGLLGSFLHSLRLHYVEFFTKFFEGGAIPFRPFGAK